MEIKQKRPKFEEALARLEKIVADMESGELQLDDMLEKFEEGRKLVQVCSSELDSIRQRIEKVARSDSPAVPPAVEPIVVL